jgi:hypothetical protein
MKKDLSDIPFRFEYPRQASEFEIQSTLYHALRQRGYDVRGEVLVQTQEKIGNAHKTIFRLDLVVFKDRAPFLIIEVKKKNRRNGIRQQMKNYSRVGVRVMPCVGEKEMNNVLAFLPPLTIL